MGEPPMRRQMRREPITIDFIGEDLLHSIFSCLPAPSCASAACVCRSWNHITTRLLSSPKFSSALSLNPSLQGAVSEVINEVLSQPIRPQFAIASIGPNFRLEEAHALISRRLGSRTPLITCISQGIIGRDALTHEFKEVKWDIVDDDGDNAGDVNMLQNANSGVLLSVGFFPGCKVNFTPLLRNNRRTQGLMVDDFVLSIREYSSLVSGTTSPQGIILFSDQETDIKGVVAKMDFAFSTETVILGDGRAKFLYQSDNTDHSMANQDGGPAALALVIANDRNKPPGLGDTQFYFLFSNGICPYGPTYKARSVRERYTENTTWLTANRIGHQENLDGHALLEHIRHEVGDNFESEDLYIGVMKKRKCSIGAEKVKWITIQEFHEVLRGDEEYLYVNDLGIKNGDTFRFYLSNPDTALSSCQTVSERLRRLKNKFEDHTSGGGGGGVSKRDKKTILCGIIFTCCGRGKSFFGRANVDSSPLLDNFPWVPIAGNFCAGEIARVGLSSSRYPEENRAAATTCCSFHVFSTAYLVVSYTPPSMKSPPSVS